MTTEQEQEIVDEVTKAGEPAEVNLEGYKYDSFGILKDMDQEWTELSPGTEEEEIGSEEMIARREKWLEGCLDTYREYLLEVLSGRGLDGALLRGKKFSIGELEEVCEGARGVG